MFDCKEAARQAYLNNKLNCTVSSAGRRSIIGKKIKKVVRQVTKPLGKLDPLGGGGVGGAVLGSLGMLTAGGREEKAAKEARKAAAADAAERKRMAEQELLATRDSNADLSSGYFADVRSGSSRKRRGISASLGL